MSALTNKNDGRFPAKLNTAHGEVAHMQIDCRLQKGNSAVVFQYEYVLIRIVLKLSRNSSKRA